MIRIWSKSIALKPCSSSSINFSGITNQLNRKYTTGEDADVVVAKKDQILTIRLNRPKKVCFNQLFAVESSHFPSFSVVQCYNSTDVQQNYGSSE